jgi:hypothetical protein
MMHQSLASAREFQADRAWTLGVSGFRSANRD